MQGKVVHCKRDEYDVYIGRGGPWGNPFSHKSGTKATTVVGTRDEAIAAYRVWLWKQINSGAISLRALAELDGKTLGCWCAPHACHGDVLTAAAAWAATQFHVADVEPERDYSFHAEGILGVRVTRDEDMRGGETALPERDVDFDDWPEEDPEPPPANPSMYRVHVPSGRCVYFASHLAPPANSIEALIETAFQSSLDLDGDV